MKGHVAVNNFSLPYNSNKALIQLRPKPENAIIEVVLLPLLVPILGLLMGRADIFFLESAFPWMLLVPTLTTSRYGTHYGLLSLLVMSCLSILYGLLFQPVLLGSIGQILVGSLLVVLVIGEMIQYWGKRNQQQAKALSEYRHSAYQSEQALQLLHISYSQLEEDLVAQNRSLAGSLRLLDTSIHQTAGTTDSKVVFKLAIQKMNDILNQYAWLESAAFYRIDQQGQLHPQSLGSIGDIPAGTYKDPLLLEAVRLEKSISIKHGKLIQSRQLNTQLKAAIPMLDSNGVIWGVMAVAEINNQALTQQNLNLLALLCNYVANLLDNSKRPQTNAKQLMQEMHTALNLVLNTVTSAALITMEVKSSVHSNDYKNYFITKVRGANRIWRLKSKHRTTLVILLPLFNEENFREFQSTQSKNFAKRFGRDFSEAGITMKYSHIRHGVKREDLQKYLVNLGKFDHASLIR